MKIVVSKDDLITTLIKVLSIVSTKPAMPILSNILIETLDDQVIISSTDLTTSMQCFLEAKVVEKGSIALPARRLSQLVRELTSVQVKISEENNIAEIVSGTSIFKLKGMDKSEFPTIPNCQGNAKIFIDPKKLKEMFSKTSFSAARDDSRFELNGINLKIENSIATFLGTDGKRLAKAKTKMDIDPSFQGSYIIPLKAVEEIIKILDDSREDAILSLTPDRIFLENKNIILTTKLVAGEYPHVERVIPETLEKVVLLHKEELVSLLKQTALFTEDSTSSIRFVFKPGQLDLLANCQEIGEGKVSMPIDYNKDKVEIAFNPFFFLDILKHTKDETVNFVIKDSYNPGVVMDSSEAIFVIMPMKLEETKDEINDPEKAFVT